MKVKDLRKKLLELPPEMDELELVRFGEDHSFERSAVSIQKIDVGSKPYGEMYEIFSPDDLIEVDDKVKTVAIIQL